MEDCPNFTKPVMLTSRLLLASRYALLTGLISVEGMPDAKNSSRVQLHY